LAQLKGSRLQALEVAFEVSAKATITLGKGCQP